MVIIIILASLIFGYNSVISKEKPKKTISMQEKMEVYIDSLENQDIICDYIELVRSDTIPTKDGVLVTRDLQITINILTDGEKLILCKPKGTQTRGNAVHDNFYSYSQILYDELYYALELARSRKIKICLTGQYTINGDFYYSKVAVLGNLFETGTSRFNQSFMFPYFKKPL
jgi:hypothetical protein